MLHSSLVLTVVAIAAGLTLGTPVQKRAGRSFVVSLDSVDLANCFLVALTCSQVPPLLSLTTDQQAAVTKFCPAYLGYRVATSTFLTTPTITRYVFGALRYDALSLTAGRCIAFQNNYRWINHKCPDYDRTINSVHLHGDHSHRFFHYHSTVVVCHSICHISLDFLLTNHSTLAQPLRSWYQPHILTTLDLLSPL